MRLFSETARWLVATVQLGAPVNSSLYTGNNGCSLSQSRIGEVSKIRQVSRWSPGGTYDAYGTYDAVGTYNTVVSGNIKILKNCQFQLTNFTLTNAPAAAKMYIFIILVDGGELKTHQIMLHSQL